ncbi:MAG: secretin N-terminal domain-containing protein [Akkermansiaceae bacterium]|nr:secretin N-terminal domain-containing protein [Akkermansiaceae bacterium]MDG2322612.1 secretin N-terminal domain-containing protein [Akkermansiaceae bacterium]
MKYSLTALIGLTLIASAQEPPAPAPVPEAPVPEAPVPNAPVPEAPVPPGAPAVPAPVPEIKPALPGAVAARAKNLDPDAIVVPEGAALEHPVLTGLEAAQLYEDHTGKRVIMSSQASQAEVFFVQRGPLTNGDVAKLLKMALLMEGLAILPDPLDPELVRLMPSGPITNPGNVPMAYITDPLDLPTEDQLVTYKMFFDHLKPEEAEKIFQSAVGQLSASGKISAVTNASSLLITENSALIRQLIKIKKDIDVSSPIGERWVEVVFADVDEIAERLNEIYNEQGGNRSTTRTTRTSTRTNTPPAPGTTGVVGGAGEDIPIKIIPDSRTNRILLVGRPAELIAVEALVKNFDIASSHKNSAVFKLRYVRVGEFLQAAQDAITATLSETSGSSAGRANSSRTTQTNNSRSTQTNSSTRNSTTGGAGGGGSRTNIQAQDIPTAPESLLIGKTHLVGDNVSNSIIVNGPPHHIELIGNLVRDLDVASQQVALSAVVGSYGLTDQHNFGVDLAKILEGSGVGFNTSFGVPSVIDPGTLNSMSNLLAARGSEGQGVALYGLIGDDLGVFVNALESNTNFRTLNRTILMTRNNRVANLSSGQRIAVPSSTFTGGNVNGSTTNVEYRDVVLELEIQPLINSDNEVTLEISIVKDGVGQIRRIGELEVPDISTEELTTSVTVQDGSAVVLGGLITEDTGKTKDGIPVLSRIPGIGRLFGFDSETKSRSELIIMIRPQIIPGTDEMVAYRERYENTSENASNAAAAFPASMLPEADTMPQETPSQQVSAAPAAEKTTLAPVKKKPLIKRRSGRPGSR